MFYVRDNKKGANQKKYQLMSHRKVHFIRHFAFFSVRLDRKKNKRALQIGVLAEETHFEQN